MDPAWKLSGEPYSRQNKWEIWIWLQPMWLAIFLEKAKSKSQNLTRSGFRELQIWQFHSLSESVGKMLSFAWVLPLHSRKISQHLNTRYKFNQKKHRQREPASVATETSSVKAQFTICNNEFLLNKQLMEGIRQRQPKNHSEHWQVHSTLNVKSKEIQQCYLKHTKGMNWYR